MNNLNQKVLGLQEKVKIMDSALAQLRLEKDNRSAENAPSIVIENYTHLIDKEVNKQEAVKAKLSTFEKLLQDAQGRVATLEKTRKDLSDQFTDRLDQSFNPIDQQRQAIERPYNKLTEVIGKLQALVTTESERLAALIQTAEASAVGQEAYKVLIRTVVTSA